MRILCWFYQLLGSGYGFKEDSEGTEEPAEGSLPQAPQLLQFSLSNWFGTIVMLVGVKVCVFILMLRIWFGRVQI